MSNILAPGFGLTQVGYGALRIIVPSLNDYIDEVSEEWAEEDEEVAALLGRDYQPIVVEHVETSNIHFGSKPSLIEDKTPMTSYPAVTVVPFRAGPAAQDTGDHYSEHNALFYVEVFVKASPTEGEEVCNHRTYRTADAVMRAIDSDRTLRGAIYDLEISPSLVVSEPFARPERADEGHGRDWFWQAARIDYAADKYSPFGT